MKVEWREYDSENSPNTRPSLNTSVWVIEWFYYGVTIGYHNGRTFLTADGSDDCEITHWAPIEYPDPPEGVDLDEFGLDLED
jgi:hypothetical protein